MCYVVLHQLYYSLCFYGQVKYHRKETLNSFMLI